MDVIEMIVEFEAHTQHRVQLWIDALSDFEKRLAEIARELQDGLNM